MRIAVVVSSDLSGGAEQYLVRLYSRLITEPGVEAVLIGASPGWDEELGPTIAVRTDRKLSMKRGRAKQAFRALGDRRRLAAEVTRARPDVVHIQFFREKLILPHRLFKRLPVIWTEHGVLPRNFPRVGLWILRRNAMRAHVVAVSEIVARSLEAEQIESDVIWNPLPPPVERASKPDVVLWAGRVVESKRAHLLVEAARRLPELTFVVAGDGSARSVLESQSPDNLKFVGHVDLRSTWLPKARVVVHTSGMEAREGSPMIMLEARASGIPFLMASDCDAAREAESLGCVLYEPAPGALAEAIRKSVEGGTDVPLSNQILADRGEQVWYERHRELFFRYARKSRVA